MKRLIPILLLLAALAPCGKAQLVYDTYGGVISNNGIAAPSCSDNTGWTMQLLNTTPKHWAYCTPTTGNGSGHSHPFIKRGVYYIAKDSDSRNQTITNTSLTSNVATITTSNSGFTCPAGTGITSISGTTNGGGAFNFTIPPQVIISTSTSTQITFTLIHADIASSADSGTLQCNNHVEVNHGLLYSNSSYINMKYGATNWYNLAYARIKAWGFNSGAPGADFVGSNSQILAANKVPYSTYGAGGPTGASNVEQHCINLGNCKNLWDLTTAAYQGSTSRNVGDVYDPAFQTFSNTEYNADTAIAACVVDPYCMGILAGDTDNYSGYSGARITAPNHPFDTDPGCPSNCGLASSWSSPMVASNGCLVGCGIAASAPRQMVNPRNGNAVFSDPLNYTKQQFCTFLQTEYTTAAAWNAAWGTGTFYTGFGTDGTQVTGATTSGSGSGPYIATLSANVDPFSVLVLVSGVGIGGDGQGHGTIQGTNISSATINYATGAISVTFTGTPAAAPTVNYYFSGWKTGHQCLDEAGAHIGNGDNTGAPGATAAQVTAQVTDMDNFTIQRTNKMLSVPKTSFNAVVGANPAKLYFGISNMGQVPGRDPSRCSELTGAGQVNDVTLVSADGSVAQMDFVSTCLGDKPYALWEGLTAEAESQWGSPLCPSGAGCANQPGSWPPSWNQATQAARGTFYQNDMSNFWNHCRISTGICGWVGFDWWAFGAQGYSQRYNFDLVTWKDNANDGVENVISTVTCSAPISAFSCGGEKINMGNFLGPVTTANTNIDANLANLSNLTVASAPTASPVSGTYASLQSVSLSTTSPAAIICWNLTGAGLVIGGVNSCPAGTTRYSSTISVSISEIIFAVAGGVGYTDSPVASFAYVIAPPSPPQGSGTVPLFFITNTGRCKLVQPGQTDSASKMCAETDAASNLLAWTPCIVCM